MDDSIHYAFVLETSELKDNWHTFQAMQPLWQGVISALQMQRENKTKVRFGSGFNWAWRKRPQIYPPYTLPLLYWWTKCSFDLWYCPLRVEKTRTRVRLETVFVSVVHLESSPLRSPPSLFWSIVVAAASKVRTTPLPPQRVLCTTRPHNNETLGLLYLVSLSAITIHFLPAKLQLCHNV